MMSVRYSKLAAAVFAASLISPSVGLGLEHTVNREIDGDRTTFRVYLNERAEADALIQISQLLRDTETTTERVWIGFFLGEPSSSNSAAGRAWATSVCPGFARFCDDLGLRVSRFTRHEWDVFGSSGAIAPSDASIVGVWRVPELLDVSIYEWEGQLYLFENWYDNSGTQPMSENIQMAKSITANGSLVAGLSTDLVLPKLGTRDGQPMTF